MSDGYLSIRNVVKSYDGRSRAIDGVSLEVNRGEFVSFLGPSGSGKTTMLMLVAGFEEVTDGTIDLAGRSLTALKPYERNIGVVFQNYALFPHMTVAENVAFALRLRRVGKAEIQDRVRATLNLVGLDGLGDKQPRQLSGGQQQRVALARSMIFNPQLLLLDEPLSALDKNLREQMQFEIKRLHRHIGITMIYVTHDQGEAMTMSDRVAVFNQGKIEQVSAPLEIYRRPATRFVAEFLGESNVYRFTIPSGAKDAGVLPDGTRIAIRTPGWQAVEDQSYELVVRPENMWLGSDTPISKDWNRLEMGIEAIVNSGPSLLIVGSAAGMPARLRLPGGHSNPPQEGQHVTIAWRPEDAHVIPGTVA